jgi:hypothetical protein
VIFGIFYTRICLIHAPPGEKKLSLFLPGGLILAEFFYCRTYSLFGTRKIKKYFFIKKHFFQNYFWKKYFLPILFFTAELSHFVGQKNQKNIFFKFFSKIWKKFSNCFFLIKKKKGIFL